MQLQAGKVGLELKALQNTHFLQDRICEASRGGQTYGHSREGFGGSNEKN